MNLNELADCPGARKRAMRVGRGIASGKGKTAGRGHKGQKSRSGVALNGREGGQMPIHMRLPKRGFRSPFSRRSAIVNLGRLDAAIEAGKIDYKSPVTSETLKAAGLIRSGCNKWRLLGKGTLRFAIAVQADHVSAGARIAVENAGGTIEIRISDSKKREGTEMRKLQNLEKKEA